MNLGGIESVTLLDYDGLPICWWLMNHDSCFMLDLLYISYYQWCFWNPLANMGDPLLWQFNMVAASVWWQCYIYELFSHLDYWLQVLLTTCVAMAPFTPFFTEVLYQNLRKASHGSDESIHYCSFPSSTGKVLIISLNLPKFKLTNASLIPPIMHLKRSLKMLSDRGAYWTKCYKDDDSHWSCSQHSRAS